MRYLLALVLLLQATQTPTPEQLREQLEAIDRSLQTVIAQLPKVPPIGTAAELQAALDAGGTVQLPAGSSYAGSFTIRRSGTSLLGNRSTIVGGTTPAIRILPGLVDVEVADLVMTSSSRSVVQCGDNGATQTRLEQQPKRIVLRGLTIPTHRGKRGIEFNCGGSILNSTIADVWASNLEDSQAVWIGNTCGPVTVQGGSYVAASENIMVGGDTLKITDCPERVAADLLIADLVLSKPLEWRTDGVRRGVKNLLELKAGKRVTVRDVKMVHSFGPPLGAQDGSAIVITPKNGQYIGEVLLERVEVDQAAAGFQLMGKDYNSVTPTATTGIVVRSSRFNVTRTLGGRGILALVVDGMQAATFVDVKARLDGPAIIQCDTQTPVGPLDFRGSSMPTGPYAVMAPGVNYGGTPPPDYAHRPCVTTFELNTFADAPSRFKANYPRNTWVTLAELPQ